MSEMSRMLNLRCLVRPQGALSVPRDRKGAAST